MFNYKKWIAMLLTLCLMFNLIPLNAVAEVSTSSEIIEENTVEPEVSSEAATELVQESEAEAVTKPATETVVESEEASVSSDETEETETDSANEEEELMALSTNSFADDFKTVLEGNGYSSDLLREDGGVVTLTVNDGKVLELLSQQSQTADRNYQNWIIDIGVTGQLKLTGDFIGLGDEGVPFKGKIKGSFSSIKTQNTLFKSVSSDATIISCPIKWAGKNQEEPIFAKELILGNDYLIPMSLSFDTSDKGAFSPFIGTLISSDEKGYEATLPKLDYTNADTQAVTSASTDIGLLCCNLGKKMELNVSNLTLPTGKQLEFNSIANTGGLVGNMEENSKLIIFQNLTLNLRLIGGDSAGGFVGNMAAGAVIELTDIVDITAELKADSAGGIAGVVETENATLTTGDTGGVIIRSIKANAAQNAGVLYGSCTVTGTFSPLTGVTFTTDAVREVSGPNNCGGVFGELAISGGGKCSITGTGEEYLPIDATLKVSNDISSDETGNKTKYGGIVGTLSGDACQNALVVKFCDVTSNISVGNNTANYPGYLGGIVALQKTVTLDAANSTITVNSPTTRDADEYGFGGLCAKLDQKTLLMADAMTVVTDSFALIPRGGGVAGYTKEGSIVYLKTSLDLSECLLTINANSGQIVGNQQSSLVYAPNVSIMRLNTSEYKGMELDDIGNYGEVYRIKDFLTVDEENYNTSFYKELSKIDEEYVLDDKLGYACLALAWQSRGNFPTVDGIDPSSWSTLKSSTITLNKDIDMTGCGIGGLTRDVYSADDVFTGIFNGNGYTLKLDIGDDNVANDVTTGDGRIYLHNATGLFATLGGSASVNNLTLEGSIRLSNNKLKLKPTSNINTNAMKSGALAALVTGNNVSITNVSTKVTFDAISNGDNHLYLGGIVGLIGYISGNNPKLTLSAESGTKLQATINLNHSNNGSFNHIGGAVGGVDNKSSINVTCDNATLSGSITSTGSITNLYAGGLIGTIVPKNSSDRNINITITSLDVNNFKFTGGASERMGGILGGIWADTDVDITSVTTTNTTLSSSDAAELGGLVYRASGKWTVTYADLSGLNITANSNTKALGLMVCHGDPYKEPINNKNATTNMNALYLEMTEYWKTGYQVPTVNNFGSGVFDEFVAYTAYADRTADTLSYDITHNGGGVISLETESSTVNMTDGSNRNTYANRTGGVSVTTNNFSRYYYNLDSIMSRLKNDDNIINTPQELLIWSVYRYAAENLKTHFSFNNVETPTIGGSSATSRADFDMAGLSYYPIDITNSDVTVQYADVKFYNEAIEEKEKGDPENKSTRGTDSDHTQHYMMHCALFHDYKAENITKTEDYILTVNGVRFAGTVGVVNDGSGALICGKVAGKTISGNTSVCKVVLADADDADKAVTLNGVFVVPTGDYTPVLINKIKDYSSLSANYITTGSGQTMIAGSSLIGDVGGESASKLTVTFGGTIKLPENTTGEGQVFTQATLLNTLQYATGSAVYNFAKEKDYNPDYVHNATHGRELGKDISKEYVDEDGNSKQGKYQGSEEYVSKTSSFTAHNDFSSDLPYVAFSPATKDDIHTLGNKWHELAVNLPSTNLIDGCGTYGHPYMVTTATFLAAANYINGGTPAEDWKICIPKNNDEYHTSADGNDHTLTYKNGKWIDENDNDYTGDVRAHLQSAYYRLSDSLTLSNFNGVGANSDTAFKGVIDGNNHTVTLTGTSTAFIKYSYGSVVRNLTVTLNQEPTLTRAAWTRGTSEQAPKTFFGGVIGCVLGGDNIVEDVTVSTAKKDVTVSTAKDFNVTPDGTNPYLVPVGGYVGVIAGGGVIFRGSYSTDTGITGTDAQLYRNPYIGRVLGGYAFYEGDNDAPNNTDKNYKINKLNNPDNDLNWNGTALTVNNAQGLIVISAIVSSGAGSTASNAYTKGVARKAKYDNIGNESKPDDYDTAMKDAGKVWENNNTPYLLAKYAGYTGTETICSREDKSGITIKFAKGATFDMNGYGNGYRGLSARYVSNAAFKDAKVDPAMVVLRVLTFDGQNATVTNMNMDVQEYNNDDFHAASIGGIFNIVWTQKQSGGGSAGSNFAQNLTLQDCNVSLKYVNDDSGTEQNLANGDTIADADGRYSVSVGGFIGMANDIGADNKSQTTLMHNYLFTNIHIKGTGVNDKCKIYGPNGVGGLVGTTAMASRGVIGYPGILLANGSWALFGPSFLNCSYQNIEVSGGMAAGGLIGDAYASGSTTVPGFSGLGISYGSGAFTCYASCTVTDKTLTVGKDSTITARAKASIAAGVFGAAGMRFGVNESLEEIKNKTGLTISGDVQKLTLSGVDVLVSKENYNGSNPDNGAQNAYAGGIIARIGSENPVWFYDVEINGGSVKSTLATSSYVGGIVGSGYTNKDNTMEHCHITDLKIEGVYAGGFLGRGLSASGFTLNLSDCSIIESNISGMTKSGYAGGVVGDAASNYYLYNLLIKNTSIKANTESNAGRLFGRMNINTAGNDFKVYAAGVSVFSDKDTVTVPNWEGGENKSYTGYIAYADYEGYADFAGKERPANYPCFMLTGVNKTMYGDAVGKIAHDSYNSVAARIWEDQKGASDKKNRVSYQNVKEIAENNDIPEVTTFQAFQEYGGEEKTYTNFPVLVLKGGDADPIRYYLNMIINSDYLNAKKNNNALVTVEDPKVYYYDTTNHAFTEATKEQLDAQPASIIKTASNTFEVKTGSYDNTLNRFTLLEVKFETTVNGEKKCYTVNIPVVVERELQYDFMATFTSGTMFNKDFYTNLKDHVLESTGTAMTALISYRYNRELNKYTEYDWQSYLDSGEDGYKLLFGDKRMDKILSFDGGLPEKTQMILIDCQNGNQAYQYEVTSNINSVKLSDFTAVCDSAENFHASVGVALGITAAEDSTGKYVRAESDNDAVLLKDGYYYTLAKAGDTSQHYRLTVPDLESITAEENYYLVITVPENDNPTYKLNGSLSSQLDWSVPTSGTQVHRYDSTFEDDCSQTESTYQIYSGYQQNLVTRPEDVQTFNVDTVDKTLTIDLDDTISFDKAQLYTENDKLFLKFTVSLSTYAVDKDDNNKVTSSSAQFPVGTSGKVKFYVHDENGNYYYPTDSGWSETNDPTTVAGEYNWESNGANIELPLSNNGSAALDLSGVRTAVKGQSNSGVGKIIVTAKMEVAFGSQNILENTIPASADGTDAYAKLHYVSRLSTVEGTLDYSMVRANAIDKVQYYRAVQESVTLSMDAITIDRLGINPLQLVEDSQSIVNGKNASWIDMMATLDFVTPEKAQMFLEKTATLRFSLSLEQRNGSIDGEKKFDIISESDANTLLAVKWSEENVDGSFGWTLDVPRDKFVGDNVDVNFFNGTMFTIPLTAYVYTESKNFANYKLKIEVSFLDENGSEVADLPLVDNSNAYVVYTYACIKPSFYEPTQ